MPPRIAPGQGRNRGGGPPPRGGRGGGAARGGLHVGNIGLPSTAAHVTTVGVKRPNFGTSGRAITVHVNMFPTTVPDSMICHYDVIEPATLPARVNLLLIKQLQTVVAPQIFTPPAVFDGRKNLFAPRKLDLGPSNSAAFDVSMHPATGTRPPKIYKIRLTLAQEINAEVLQRFVAGQQSNDNTVLTAIMALNVVIRMEPTMKYPFNSRSFFTKEERKDIGMGLELWRGYFQSLRPAMGRMLINVDISTGMMYKGGPLSALCLEFLGKGWNADPKILSPKRGLPDRERLRLQRFISGLRMMTEQPAGRPPKAHVIKKISSAGADALTFSMRDGTSLTVADYFRNHRNRPLRFPEVLCIEVGSGALIPIELCTIPEGQLMRKQVPPEKTKDVLDFATKKPAERLGSIVNGLSTLAYGQSEYVRQFGMSVDTTSGPLSVEARVLPPPTLKYGPGSKQLTITPRDGAWNMIDKKFMVPATINNWVIVIYERQQRFPNAAVSDMINGILQGCQSVGITVRDRDPIVRFENGQGRIGDQLRNAGAECAKNKGAPPNLIVVVLPDGGNDIYTAVKHFGDITMGVATQCLKSGKCSRAKPQYWANVLLKVNVKLGGINLIPDPASVAALTDPHNPTIVMGADVMHPAPGAEGRPSFTALVANVDSDTAKYIATTRAQKSRQEIIDDLQAMAKHVLTMYMAYRSSQEKKGAGLASAPKRIIFYRDGVSEGQFQQVLDQELKMLKNACEELKIKPKITMVIVGKRHHLRIFPNQRDADRSGNAPAGTVIDRDIAHPTEYDFYLQSHGGLLGTSRSAHYSVLYDENGFNADSMQSLSFALCHVYARSTRSVSIPAPVYYADIVCARAKNHYDPQGTLDFSDSATQNDDQANAALEAFKTGFKPLHATTSRNMYFM